MPQEFGGSHFLGIRLIPQKQPSKAPRRSRDHTALEPKNIFGPLRERASASEGRKVFSFFFSGGPDSQTRCRPKRRIFISIFFRTEGLLFIYLASARSPASVSAREFLPPSTARRNLDSIQSYFSLSENYPSEPDIRTDFQRGEKKLFPPYRS